MTMATPLLLRQGLLHRLRFTVAAPHRLWCNAATPTTNSSSFSSSEHANEKPSSGVTTNNTSNFLLKPNDPDYCKWKVEEDGILRDDEPIVALTKDILHSSRYMDGEHLSVEDEKAVVKNLLPYHPHSEDKIGCGIYSIMVDRHHQFQRSRCLFVVRTDGSCIDFSYRKCLQGYITDKYPSYAERFIREHFKRGRG
ncbi:PREDICTED: protein DCL, chloroplastic-like [Lupinus angustifolius]|uniref:protein DCL, chloroplastic-like n=1 Tax=Lupinus angustifolius TaxID=3871 RepID=UPI00092E63F4|nr:PREDICTED: protein DCL, chloroplastic-like [Lupinus angustifolius]